jgi:fumarylacetoacetase
MHVPARVGDYTDFFAGIHHATNAGKQLRRQPSAAQHSIYPSAGTAALHPSVLPARRCAAHMDSASRRMLMRRFDPRNGSITS